MSEEDKKIEEVKEEENLEEDVESVDENMFSENEFSDFSNFVSNASAPVLEPSVDISENRDVSLEETAGQAPSIENTEKESENNPYETNYDTRGYDNLRRETGEISTPLINGMEKTGVIIRPDEIREANPIREIREWPEIDNARGGGTIDRVTGTTRLEQNKKLPFEEKTKYKNKHV